MIMTLIKSMFQRKEGGLTKSTCAKLIKKTKPFNMLSIIAQSSSLIYSSLNLLQDSFLHGMSSLATKKKSSSVVYASKDAHGTKYERGPLELRGRELLNKFRAVVKTIEAPSTSSSGHVEAVGTEAPETKQDTNLRCISSKVRTEHIPPKLPFAASDLLNASKVICTLYCNFCLSCCHQEEFSAALIHFKLEFHCTVLDFEITLVVETCQLTNALSPSHERFQQRLSYSSLTSILDAVKTAYGQSSSPCYENSFIRKTSEILHFGSKSKLFSSLLDLQQISHAIFVKVQVTCQDALQS